MEWIDTLYGWHMQQVAPTELRYGMALLLQTYRPYRNCNDAQGKRVTIEVLIFGCHAIIYYQFDVKNVQKIRHSVLSPLIYNMEMNFPG